MTHDFAQSLAEVSVVVARHLPKCRPCVCVELAHLSLEGSFNPASLSQVPEVLGRDDEDIEPYQVALSIAAAAILIRTTPM